MCDSILGSGSLSMRRFSVYLKMALFWGILMWLYGYGGGICWGVKVIRLLSNWGNGTCIGCCWLGKVKAKYELGGLEGRILELAIWVLLIDIGLFWLWKVMFLCLFSLEGGMETGKGWTGIPPFTLKLVSYITFLLIPTRWGCTTFSTFFYLLIPSFFT